MFIYCDGIRIAYDRIPEDGDRDEVLRGLCKAIECDAGDMVVGKDALGAPRLLGAEPLPAVSFSSSRGERWVAVAWAGGLGVDAACPCEFEPPYPYGRVFGEAEVGQTISLGLERLSGYALLWSMKEAVAKCFGGGFHTVEPSDITAHGLKETEQGIEAELSAAGTAAGVTATPVDDCWLAFSACKGQ